MSTLHRTASAVLLALLSLASVQVHAQTVRIPALPPSQWADTEAVQAFTPPLWDSAQREYSLTLSLDATASNNLEVAFWDNATESLETASVIGWNRGEIFISDGFTRAVADFTPISPRLTLSFRIRIVEQGTALKTTITANGSPLEFLDSEGGPVPFVFSSAWNAAQIVSRGVDATQAQLVIGFARDPSIIMVR